jgi:hypothetical protein
MRRVLAMLLVLFFGLGPLTATLQADEAARLPACCRRHGAHHCAMAGEIGGRTVASAANLKPAWSAPSRCPLYPQRVFATASSQSAIVASLHAPAQGDMQRQLLEPAAPLLRSLPFNHRTGRSPPPSDRL